MSLLDQNEFVVFPYQEIWIVFLTTMTFFIRIIRYLKDVIPVNTYIGRQLYDERGTWRVYLRRNFLTMVHLFI